MDQSTIARLLTRKRKRWVWVAWGLLLLGMLVLPDVDRSIADYRELGELRVKLAARAELPDRARMLAERVAEIEEETADLEAALVPPDALPTFKQDLTRMARSARCRLRSIRPGRVTQRPLDEVLSRADNDAKSPTRNAEWEVEEQISSLAVQGSFGNLLAFLSALENDVRIVQFSALHLHPSPDTTEELLLDLHVKTFNLVRKDQG